MQKELSALLRETVNTIQRKKTAIFCGAGISFHSGLPLANDILKEILYKIDVEETQTNLILNSSLPFEAFIETIKEETDIDDLLEIFNSGKSNTNHKFIAKLVASGYISIILTTNFDVLIEEALAEEHFYKDKHYQIFSNEEEFGRINWHDNKVKLIKIHGCVSNKEMMAITMQSVANETYCANKNSVIKYFFSKEINEAIIILGYSCSDLFDLSPQIELINANESNVLLVEHWWTPNGHVAIESLPKAIFKNPFKHFSDSKRLKIDTDTFVKTMWQQLHTFPYEFIRYPISDWKSKINSWLLKAIEAGTIGAKHHLSARLFYGIGQFELAINSYKKGIEIAYLLQERFNVCSELGNMALTLNALSRFDEALKCLKISLKLCRILNNVQGEVAQLQCLGNIYLNLADYNSSENAFQKAIIRAREQNLPQSLCTAFGNLALVYNAMKRYDETIKCVKIGIAICHDLGNKQAEASQLSSLGTAYFITGDREKGIEYLEQGKVITQLIGDRRNECMVLGNLANCYTIVQDYERALQNALRALQLSQEIGTKQMEAMAFYMVGTVYNYKNEVKNAIAYLENALTAFLDIFDEDHPNIQSTKKAISLAKYRFSHPDFPNPDFNWK